jgi:hypothetical protein
MLRNWIDIDQRYRQLNYPELIESADDYLQTPPIPYRLHQLLRMALLSCQSQARGSSHLDIEDLLA